MGSAAHRDEAFRLARLYALQILDTEPEDLFDSLVSAAADACGVEIGLMNLIDRDRLWSKASSVSTQRYDLPRHHTICTHTIAQADGLEVEDLRVDPRFWDSPVVDRPSGFRFYAGMPLKLANGACVGTLCVLDSVPRVLTDTQRRILSNLAVATVRVLEAREASIAAVTAAKRAELTVDRLYNVTPAILHATDAAGCLTHVSDLWLTEFGYGRTDVIGHPIANFVPDASTPLQGPGRMLCADGRLTEVQALSIVDLDGDDLALGTRTVLENITARLATQAALAHSRSFLERTGAVAGVGGWEVDLATNQVTWSDQTCRLHDRDIGHRPTLEEGLAYYAPSARPIITEAIRQAIENARPWDLELPLVSAGNRPFWARVAGTVEFQEGKAVRLSGAFQDITDRKRLEQQLADSRHLLETTLESIADAVITTNLAARVEWMNPVAEVLTGWSRQQASGTPLGTVMSLKDRTGSNPVECAVLRCIVAGHTEKMADDAILLGQGGTEFAVQISAAPIRGTNSDVLGSVVVFHDVSEQRKQRREMQHRATHDALTEVLNRTGLTLLLNGLLDEAKREPEQSHILLSVDLDRFKVVNDSCGHAVGDILLQEVSRLMQSAIRAGDVVARVGGDEFCVVLKNCREDQAFEVAERIRTEVGQYRLSHGGSSYRVGTSIGLVPMDSRWPTLAQLLQAGDMTCYAAKEAGRNCICLWSDTEQATADHALATRWVSRLERALDEDRFELYAQRIESAAGGNTGLRCEVLLRMVETDGSLVLPGAFIEAAERFHMAPLLDRWMVRKVFACLNDHRYSSDDIDMISINLSGQSLGDRAFGTQICDHIRSARFDVSRLCVEITETSAIARFSDARRFVDEIRSFGVKVALDDFGAGASSFGYLKNLTVDFLKIDGQFIRELPNDSLDLAMVRCFRDIARSIGIRTVAEFVERQEQKDALLALGIDMVQGNLIHLPQPLADLLPLRILGECAGGLRLEPDGYA